MEWIADPTAWLGLLTLIVLEIVLGIDNLVFIAILAEKLPPSQRDKARVIGLSLALIMRLGLLASLSWLVTLTEPLFEIFGKAFSGRDLIMLFGGLFLLFKATMELHERLEGHIAKTTQSRTYAMFWPIVAQIVVLDAVFSLDSVITAVGMVDDLEVMMIAVIVSIGLMIVASKPLTAFVNARPTVIMLCLGFLLMIGLSLTADGLGFHIPKGYLYAAIGFSILIESLNQLARWKRKKSLQGQHTVRERTAHAVLRLMGGRPLEHNEADDEISDLQDGSETRPGEVFARRERLMISGVLQLAERPVRSVMTSRSEISFIDLEENREALQQQLVESRHSRLVVTRHNQIDEPLGYIHKKEVLKDILSGQDVDLETLVHPVIHLSATSSVLSALEVMRNDSTHIGFVVDGSDSFIGIVTMTDILESIAGELPDINEMDLPDIVEREGRYWVDGTIDLAALAKRTDFPGKPTEDYRTLAGLLLDLLDRLPRQGDKVTFEGWTLEVSQVEERRILQVCMTAPA